MARDFFEFVQNNSKPLNVTEMRMFDFVVKNMDRVKYMSIRMLAHECFVSTTTVFRFVKKLGFLGYNQFLAMLQLTDDSAEQAVIPKAMRKEAYSEEYLKNIIETVRVLKKESVKELREILRANPKTYLVSAGLALEAARYVQHLMTVLGYDAELVGMDYEITSMLRRVHTGDLVFVFSYTGEEQRLVGAIERVKSESHAKVVSVTRADNNMVQMLSDINFYFFADELIVSGVDITSRISVIAVMEMVFYEMFAQDNGSLFTKK